MEKKMAMKKIMRKVLSCLFVIAILMSMVPGTVFAFEPIPTKIHLQDATFKWHTNQSVIAELVDENNQSLSGKEVLFYVNTSVGWHELGNSMTNESGIAKYDIFVTMQNGTYSFKADFKGDLMYVSSSDTAEITVIDNIVLTVTAAFIVKVIVIPAAVHIVKECVWKPYGSPLAADFCEEHDIRVPIGDDILQKKETWDSAADIAVAVHDVKSIYKYGAKAVYQHGAKAAAAGRAIGGHARWLYYNGQHAIATGGGAFLGEMLGHAVVEYGLTDDQKDSIHGGMSPAMDSASQTATHIFNSKMPQKVRGCIVDPIIGHGEQIKVPEDTARMRIYLGWEFDVCPYRLDFYILKDPYGNDIAPSFKYLDTPEGTAVELKVDNPLSGNWNLWLDGSVVPNWTMGILYSFDSYIDILPEHQAVNPGKTVVYKIMVSNFKDLRSTVDLSISNVPAGWNTELSKAKITLAPYTSDIVDLSVVPPITVRYGINKVITVTAEFKEDSTSYSDDCTVHISPAKEIEDGIAWLHEHQKSDGSWNNNVGVTSLATLVYLNAGYDENMDDVQEGIDYILGYGHVHSDGSIYSDYDHRLYETAIAMLPLIATYNSSYNDIIADARDWLVKAQWDEDCLFGSVNKDNWYYGGFGYGRNIRPDLSNTQFALMALDAADLPKNNPVWSKAQVFLERTQARDESNDQAWANGRNTGGFIYTPDGGTAGGGSIDGYGSMTGAGIWGLMLCGADQTDDRLKDALKWVKNNYYWDRNPGMSDPESGKYYYYLCMSKALAMAVGVEGKIDGHYWYDDMARNLISLQKSEGYWVNSNSWAWENIPDLATSYSLLSLETRIIPSEISRLSYLTFILCSNADLHVYDPLGRHVGKNYATGGIDLEIPGATFDKNGIQKIHIPNLEAGDYKIKLVGTSSGGYDLNIIGGLGEKRLREESYSSTISKGEVHDASVNVAMLTGLTLHVTPPTPPQNQLPSSPTSVKEMWRYKTNGRVEDVKIADIDNDSDFEVIVASDKLYILNMLGGKERSFSQNIESVEIGDMNGDGIKDIIAGQSGGIITAYTGNGLEFWSHSLTTDYPKVITSFDLNNDGLDDVLIASRECKFYLISGDGRILWIHSIGVWSDTDSMEGAIIDDINNDNVFDIVVGGRDSKITALSGINGLVIWEYAIPGWIGSVINIGDLNGDAYDDVVVGSWDTEVYAINGNDGSLLWKFVTPVHGHSPASVAILGDINSDGIPDVAAGLGDVYALDGKTGHQIWKSAESFLGLDTLVSTDLNADGSLDVCIGTCGSDQYANVYAVNGYNGNTLWSFLDPESTIYGLTAGDIDNDGKNDIIAGSQDTYVYALTTQIISETVGAISLSSSPSGATILLDVFVGPSVKTPYTLTNVPVGTSTITLSLDGYHDWSTRVYVTAGQTTTVHATLTPINITSVDTTAPVVTCPADVTVELETKVGTVVNLEVTATDNCDLDPIITDNELDIYPLGTTTVTFTATDASGNRATCSTKVAVVDTAPPSITDIMVSPTTISPGTQIVISATAFDFSMVRDVRGIISKDGEELSTVFMLDPEKNGIYTGTWRTMVFTERGIYNIDICATDVEGNEAVVKGPAISIASSKGTIEFSSDRDITLSPYPKIF